MQSESFTRTNSTMSINDHEHTQKPGKLFKKLFLKMCRDCFPLDYPFFIQIGSLKDEIMIMSLFFGFSLILHPLPI